MRASDLAAFTFVDAFSPMPDRYADHDAYVPHALELVSKLLNTDGLVAI